MAHTSDTDYEAVGVDARLNYSSGNDYNVNWDTAWIANVRDTPANNYGTIMISTDISFMQFTSNDGVNVPVLTIDYTTVSLPVLMHHRRMQGMS